MSLSAARRRRRCGNVGTRVCAGFQARWDGQQIFGQDSTIGPTERHFHSETGFLPILVQISSLAAAQDQNVRFQKPAQNEHFYRLSCRAHKRTQLNKCRLKDRVVSDSLFSDAPSRTDSGATFSSTALTGVCDARSGLSSGAVQAQMMDISTNQATSI